MCLTPCRICFSESPMQNARCGCETRKRRQAEGIAIAKKSGIYTGRKPDLKRSEVIRTLRKQSLS